MLFTNFLLHSISVGVIVVIEQRNIRKDKD